MPQLWDLSVDWRLQAVLDTRRSLNGPDAWDLANRNGHFEDRATNLTQNDPAGPNCYADARSSGGGTVATMFRRRRDSKGVAAVEFALVTPILFVVMFGIIQYGLWFNDSLNTRQGVREAARMGVVANYGATSACAAKTGMDKLACETVHQIDAVTGKEYVKVTAASWSRGKPLVVCAYVNTDGGVGLLPMPNGGWIFSRTEMSIEDHTAVPTPLNGTSTPALPADAPAWPTGC